MSVTLEREDNVSQFTFFRAQKNSWKELSPVHVEQGGERAKNPYDAWFQSVDLAIQHYWVEDPSPLQESDVHFALLAVDQYHFGHYLYLCQHKTLLSLLYKKGHEINSWIW
jgi:hypothetical protein